MSEWTRAGDAYSNPSYSRCWSSQCLGRFPSASYCPSSMALSLPSSPGGSTLRKPPASFVPYGCTAADAGTARPNSTATVSAAVLPCTRAGTLPQPLRPARPPPQPAGDHLLRGAQPPDGRLDPAQQQRAPDLRGRGI